MFFLFSPSIIGACSRLGGGAESVTERGNERERETGGKRETERKTEAGAL